MFSRFSLHILVVPLVVTVLATCSFDQAGGGPDPYANHTTLDLCLELCPKWVECDVYLYDCEMECATRAKDGAGCDAEFREWYLCYIDRYKQLGCDAWQYDNRCDDVGSSAEACARHKGCNSV